MGGVPAPECVSLEILAAFPLCVFFFAFIRIPQSDEAAGPKGQLRQEQAFL